MFVKSQTTAVTLGAVEVGSIHAMLLSRGFLALVNLFVCHAWQLRQTASVDMPFAAMSEVLTDPTTGLYDVVVSVLIKSHSFLSSNFTDGLLTGITSNLISSRKMYSIPSIHTDA